MVLISSCLSARYLFVATLVLGWPFIASAQMTPASPAYGAELEGFTYPFEVKTYAFTSQGRALQMRYMDISPTQPDQANGRTVVLMHGKNFCAATWEGTITALTGAGYRVIAPDQIGFCKSSKPDHYQYSFHQLAANTNALLQSLGIQRVTVMGHSMGGMLATRYALQYPQQTEQLVMVNPIGLEDWKTKGVPYLTPDQWYENELKTNAQGIRNYQQSTYYVGQWRPEFDRWVNMQAGMYAGPGREIVAWNSALTYEMVYTQPVVYEFPTLTVPTLLLIGTKDNTAIGKNFAPPAMRGYLGNYAALGKAAAAAIPNAKLIEFEYLGHSPQIQEADRFHAALLNGLVLTQPKQGQPLTR
ncbi:alpha/beta fold hydrolase [Oxalicibacterium faecigallinarum]|uniref:Alpha/beta hydrolase n=1 Tax=Oxalicibacterium faecigallinarum TaxID=573741 RepID=A0A8J3AQW7_9BURK|nr:alpha/beta hydrolase [Oxalicibacterium faecigallinarum]GGI17079.1 alpha/beta hydrolase [Oxalicibacterium faecigallinarum]